MNRPIHIVCLDAPSPPDYGGAIDMFYKVRALAQLGWRIHLHYFAYRKNRNTAGLADCCQEIHQYERKGLVAAFPLTIPFIVGSRINTLLIQRLNADKHPILLEGLHCAGLVSHIKDTKRIVLRMHNEEASYYHHLAQSETSVFKKAYYRQESRLLKKFQHQLNKSVHLACVAQTDESLFADQYGFQQTAFIPCFLPWQSLAPNKGRGAFCLYHGNLSVAENEEAAMWLMTEIFRHGKHPLVIAGKGLSKRLVVEAARHSNVSLVNDPSIRVIDGLVREAQINVLPSLNRTGVKLKLLNALFNGRYCITNPQGIDGSGIKNGVIIASNADAWQTAINQLMPLSFEKAQVEERKSILQRYNNYLNATKLSELW